MDDILYDPFIPHPFTYQDESEWAQAVEEAQYRHVASGWEVADLLLWGIEHLCKSKDNIADMYNKMSEQLGKAPHTLQNKVSCARKFPPNRRHPGLTIEHHIVLQGKDEEEQDHWLHEAYVHGWEPSMLRAQVFVRDPEETPALWEQVESALHRSGVRAVLRNRRGELQLPSRITVVVEAESNLKWSVIP